MYRAFGAAFAPRWDRSVRKIRELSSDAEGAQLPHCLARADAAAIKNFFTYLDRVSYRLDSRIGMRKIQ